MMTETATTNDNSREDDHINYSLHPRETLSVDNTAGTKGTEDGDGYTFTVDQVLC